MIPGVVDLNLGEMSDEELAQVVEEARRLLAGRQTRGAIATDLEGAVDRVVGPNLNLMGEGWTHGRVSWDGESVTVTALSPEEYLDLDFPDEPEAEPEPEESAREWVAGMSVSVGDLLRYEDDLYRVVQAHVTASHWLPPTLPALYQKEG